MTPENSNLKIQAQQPPAEVKALIALYNAQRYAEVENKARQLTALFPASALLWKLLGAALQMQGKDALPALQNSAKLLN